MPASSTESPNDPGSIPGLGGGTLQNAKRELRARIVRERDAMPEADRTAASTAIGNSLSGRDDFTSSRTVLLTLPFGSEWDTSALLTAALDRGKIVALPRVNRTTRMLDLCVIAHPARDVAPGYRGIPEPGVHCAPLDAASIDWVLVPGVAFDGDGRRIGYGGGYYDRLLPLLRADARRVAGAFELQRVDRVPAAAHDVTVDALVTEARTLTIAR